MTGEHFVLAPQWEWYILLYFFFAGLSGGSFVIATMLRLWGSIADQAASRLGFLISFPLLLLCPILLTLDLGKPFDFWHMLVDTGPGGGLALKPWSPMSLGAWGLLLFGLFSFIMFVLALAEGDYVHWSALGAVARIPATIVGAIVMVIGSILGLFIAAYTGVLLAVSNQPVWSDTWSLGALFLASGLSGAAAALMLVSYRYREASITEPKLVEADRYFIILELVLIVLFLIGLGGLISKVLGAWILLWLVVLIGTVVPLLMHWRPTWVRQVSPVLSTVLVLVGVLALRAVIIFSAQA